MKILKTKLDLGFSKLPIRDNGLSYYIWYDKRRKYYNDLIAEANKPPVEAKRAEAPRKLIIEALPDDLEGDTIDKSIRVVVRSKHNPLRYIPNPKSNSKDLKDIKYLKRKINKIFGEYGI